MKKFTLTTQKRDTKKQKVKALRREGLLPATVYGKNVKSESVVMALKDFIKVYADAHETGLVELSLDGSIKPVLIHHVQRDPVDDAILHIEFHQVDLKVKVKASVPLVFVGVAPAVTQKLGVLLSVLSEVEVEALPAELPEKIEVDVSGLEAVDQELKASDLKIPDGVMLLTDGALVVSKVGALVSKEAQAQAVQEAAAAAEAAVEAAPEAGAASTEEAPKAATSGEETKEAAKPQSGAK